MTSILITGGAGFIGSNFVRHWRRLYPHDIIVVLDALTYAGNRANLAGFAGDPAFDFVQGDICDSDLVAALFKGQRFDAVAHFAAESHVDRSIADPQAFMRTNVIGTQTLLQTAVAAWDGDFGTRRFLHVSTDEVYGPLDDDAPPATEAAPLNPTSPYAASKAANDLVALSFARTYGLPVFVARCSNNYGPFQFPEMLIPLIILNALHGRPLPVYGDGLHIREWLYVDDACTALATIMARGQAGETYNVGSGVRVSNIELVRHLCGIVDRYTINARSEALISHVRDRPGHDRRYALSCARLENELGVAARTALDDGLSRTVEWYLAGESWWRPLLSGPLGDWMRRHYGVPAWGDVG